DNDLLDHMLVRFFDRFVRGKRNGFEATPHFQVWHEAHQVTQNGTAENVPSWVTTFGSWPPTTRPTPLYLRAGGRLDDAKATTAEYSDTYVFTQEPEGTEAGDVIGLYRVLC